MAGQVEKALPSFCEGDEPEVMMKACLHIMAPGDRSSSSAEQEIRAFGREA
jgi:hypothetical protein